MKCLTIFTISLRLVTSLFFALTSFYCILAYLPFTYQQVVNGALIPMLSQVARLNPLLADLRNDDSPFYRAVALLLPWLAWGAADCFRFARRVRWRARASDQDLRLFHACWRTAVFVAVVYWGIAFWRSGVADIPALLASILSHLLIFLGLFAVFNLIGALANHATHEFALIQALSGAFVFVLLDAVVFPQISFSGTRASLYAALFAAAFTMSMAAIDLRLSLNGEYDGIGAAFAPFRWLRGAGWFALSVLAPLAWFLAVRTAVLDWNYLLQKCCVVLVWVIAFSCFYMGVGAPRGIRVTTPAMIFFAVLVLAGFKLLGAESHPKYAAFDVSYRLITDLVAHPSDPGQKSLYDLLARSTNISRAVKLVAPSVLPVARLSRASGPLPNIFLFVIDSLRPDYLSPYNPKVDFTPSIGAFARESVVFANAFSRYGGTGLSEPSLWVGGMLAHQQYVTPFYPMNALQKLLEADGYRGYITIDNVLRSVVKPDPSIMELDRDRLTMSLDFCTTLSELKQQLAKPLDAPIFVYTQPQNIHISVIQRANASVLDGAAYPEFFAPYASRLRRVDGCFGGFLRFLKDQGLFDDSIIILTADHGDSLGEEGRWGHAYTIFPEILRIPLLFHLPRVIRQLYHEPSRPAFLTDITPSLYYLLGHRPIRSNDLFGRPLFTETAAEQHESQQNVHLMASSYAPVYGLFNESRRNLLIVDATNHREYFYDMYTGRPLSENPPADAAAQIKKFVEGLNTFYGFDPNH